MSSSPPPALGATRRTASIHLDNKTGSAFKFTLRHEYTGWPENRVDNVIFQPDDYKEMMTVPYNTGFGTTGVDNWIIEGVKLEEKDGGYVEKEHYRSGGGALASWKVHSLRSEDEGVITTIRVHPSKIEFISPSGTSTTDFSKK